MIMIYVTNKDMQSAKALAKTLLEKQLIACANLFPITSMYKWEGKTEEEEEVVALLKSDTDWETLKLEIRSIHPYKTPCIIKIDTQANTEFEEWVNSMTP